jgi:hypothetical protein
MRYALHTRQYIHCVHYQLIAECSRCMPHSLLQLLLLLLDYISTNWPLLAAKRASNAVHAQH